MGLQVASVVGALLVLAAYALIQRGVVNARSIPYNWMNFVGALLLLWVAMSDRRVGFILLEGVWALIAIPGLLRAKGGPEDGPSPGAVA